MASTGIFCPKSYLYEIFIGPSRCILFQNQNHIPDVVSVRSHDGATKFYGYYQVGIVDSKISTSFWHTELGTLILDRCCLSSEGPQHRICLCVEAFVFESGLA